MQHDIDLAKVVALGIAFKDQTAVLFLVDVQRCFLLESFRSRFFGILFLCAFITSKADEEVKATLITTIIGFVDLLGKLARQVLEQLGVVDLPETTCLGLGYLERH